MAPYKVPRQVEFRAHSCLRKVGKMLRKELPLIREKLPGIVTAYSAAGNLLAWANIDELGSNILDIGTEVAE
ncbi:MAG: hypothetical protein ACO3PV_12065, partial [Pseudohongiellaceae bacterium]